MGSFDPKDVSRGASRAFSGFVKSVMRTGGGGSFAGASPQAGSPDDACADFAYQWGLDERAQEMLYALDPDLQSRVMSGFAPKDLSKGASAAFMGFVMSVQRTQGRPAQPRGALAHYAPAAYAPQPAVHYAPPPRAAPRPAMMAVQPAAVGAIDPAALEAFIQQWDLDSSAQGALMRCTAEVQARVIQDFSPKDTSSGASRAFMGFLKSVTTAREAAV